MADFDTAAKRVSGLGWRGRRQIPRPDGALAGVDLQTLLKRYDGIAWGEPVEPVVVARGRTSGGLGVELFIDEAIEDDDEIIEIMNVLVASGVLWEV